MNWNDARVHVQARPAIHQAKHQVTVKGFNEHVCLIGVLASPTVAAKIKIDRQNNYNYSYQQNSDKDYNEIKSRFFGNHNNIDLNKNERLKFVVDCAQFRF